MPVNLAIPKFIGTISLGLLTGISYTLSTTSLPALLTLPSAKHASHTLTTLLRTTDLHIRILSALSCLSLSTAYLLAPPRSKHPYLLWTALLSALGGSADLLSVSAFIGYSGSSKDVKATAAKAAGAEEDVNGEMVEKAVRTRQATEGIRSGILGVAFAMGVVGIWGDGA